jgi:hypothetical protein
MKQILKKLVGLDKEEKRLEEERKRLKEEEAELKMKAEAERKARVAERKVLEQAELDLLKKENPKEYATRKKQPWVSVLDVKVNEDNVRNGFFELDWNKYFIEDLKRAGYNGETDEVIVDQWFQDLCRNIGSEEGINMERRSSGYINVNNLGNGKSEIS